MSKDDMKQDLYMSLSERDPECAAVLFDPRNFVYEEHDRLDGGFDMSAKETSYRLASWNDVFMHQPQKVLLFIDLKSSPRMINRFGSPNLRRGLRNVWGALYHMQKRFAIVNVCDFYVICYGVRGICFDTDIKSIQGYCKNNDRRLIIVSYPRDETDICTMLEVLDTAMLGCLEVLIEHPYCPLITTKDKRKMWFSAFCGYRIMMKRNDNLR